MAGDELLQDGWQGGGIKQTGGPAENKCRRQLKYRTYPQSYFHLVLKLIKPLFPLTDTMSSGPFFFFLW